MGQDLQTNEQRPHEALQKISSSELTTAIIHKQYKKASDLLPRTFKEVFEQPKVSELIVAIGLNNVLRQIEFELITLTTLVSVGGNLNDAMIQLIARELSEKHPTESIADFKLCFERGAAGRYGEMQRLDGPTIAKWMSFYLEEKYTTMEKFVQKEKTVDESGILAVVTDDEKINGYLNQIKENAKNAKIKSVAKLDQQEIRKFGQERPVQMTQQWTTSGEYEAHELHKQWALENHDVNTGHRKENWISEEQWLKEHGKI